MAVDKRWNFHSKTPSNIKNNYILEKQTDKEIEDDILEIRKLLYPKKIIIVSHYNSKLNNEYIHSRNNLISLLNIICKKHNITFINPTEVLSNFHQNQVMKKDLGHYTSFGLNQFSKYMNHFISNRL